MFQKNVGPAVPCPARFVAAAVGETLLILRPQDLCWKSYLEGLDAEPDGFALLVGGDGERYGLGDALRPGEGGGRLAVLGEARGQPGERLPAAAAATKAQASEIKRRKHAGRPPLSPPPPPPVQGTVPLQQAESGAALT